MRTGEKKKLIGAGVLFALALTWLYFSLSPGSSAASAPDPASQHQSTLKSLTNGDPVSGAPAAKQQHGRNLTGALSIDPVLRLDLLAKAQTIRYEGNDRNIFQFYTAPPPPLPAPKTPVIVGGNNNNNQKMVDPLSTPPPSILLKYYGVVTTLGTSAKKACLQDGDEIFVAAEGDLVKKRYRVLRINDLGTEHNVEMEDTQTKAKTKIPLQEGGDKG